MNFSIHAGIVTQPNLEGAHFTAPIGNLRLLTKQAVIHLKQLVSGSVSRIRHSTTWPEGSEENEEDGLSSAKDRRCSAELFRVAFVTSNAPFAVRSTCSMYDVRVRLGGSQSMYSGRLPTPSNAVATCASCSEMAAAFSYSKESIAGTPVASVKMSWSYE